MRQYGFNIEKELTEQSSSDWVFGQSPIPCIAQIPEVVRELYLPAGEKQNIGQEKMDCASRSPLNILEAKFNYLYKNGKLKNKTWLEKNGYVNNGQIEFSDRFVAINSGTTASGNSLKAPLEAIRKQGLIPKSMFPQVSTFNEYYDRNKMTTKMVRLGEEFAKIFVINYEKVYEVYFSKLLQTDVLDSAGFAWPQPVNGIYPRSDNQPNHAFMVFKNKYFAFDNYLDENKPNDWIKQLAPNYNFLDYGYRVYITEEIDRYYIDNGLDPKANWLMDFWNILKGIFIKLGSREEILKQYTTILQKTILLMQKVILLKKYGVSTVIYEYAKDCIGKDMAERLDEYGCAEALNTVIEQATGLNIGGGYSTYLMYHSILNNPKRFIRRYVPQKGYLVISPSGYGKGNGHCGIISDNGNIMSNNSDTGLWNEHLSIITWNRTFKARGFPVYYFEVV